ncbi:Arc family DNA-binding protein [Salmonella enterica]|nr:Arc family DNA-binding protein [Salmonella enterica]EDW0096181.1 Arc family DNA-binding protein [Salmonella enterica subsp. enterica serovar Gaminara]EBC0167629.1 Arc family DNA-binding protein [Salmonella enterica]EBR2769201.1 Arc family DNA-binding protein [Salmonella enterica]EHS7369293.1 Arc family DNA-binding protein [Salmonella enterica]
MKREPTIHIRLSQELKDQLHSLAKDNKRSVNAEAVAAIEAAIHQSIGKKEPWDLTEKETDFSLEYEFKKQMEKQEEMYREMMKRLSDLEKGYKARNPD